MKFLMTSMVLEPVFSIRSFGNCIWFSCEVNHVQNNVIALQCGWQTKKNVAGAAITSLITQ